MARYEDLLDELEEKNKLLTFRLKSLEAEAKEWRGIANSLSHALALSAGKKQPLWVQEYYRKWEIKNKEWWGV